MFFKYTVPVPVAAGKISRQKTKSGTYILYVISRQYDPAKKHTVPVRAMIGKVSDEEGMMFPNEKFFEYFPETPLPELRPEAERSCTLMAGTFIAIGGSRQSLPARRTPGQALRRSCRPRTGFGFLHGRRRPESRSVLS